jgi:hypothetical protein
VRERERDRREIKKRKVIEKLWRRVWIRER